MSPARSTSGDTEVVSRQWVVAGILLYCLLTSIFLLTNSARLGTADGGSMFNVTRSLYVHRWFDAGPCTEELHGNQCVRGVDGRMYSGYGIVPSAVAYPAFALGWRAAKLLHKDPAQLASAAVASCGCFVTPLIAVVFLAWCRQLGYSLRTSVLASLLLSLATPIWFHATKGFYSEPYFTLAFLLCVYTMDRPSKSTTASALESGLWFGVAMGCRIFGLVLLPVLLYYLYLQVQSANCDQATSVRTRGIHNLKPVMIFVGAVAVAGILIGLFNEVRFGSPTKSGYQLAFPTVSALLGAPISEGLPGVLFNGEVGLLWYTPLVLLLPFAWPRFHRLHVRQSWLCAGISLLTILFYGKYASWHGGWAYGPRLLVPILPFLTLPLVTLIDPLFRRGATPANVGSKGAMRVCFVVLAVVSLLVQMTSLSSSMSRYYDLERYGDAVGQRPAWDGWPLIESAESVPELIRFRVESLPARKAEAGVEPSLEDPANRTSPEVYLSRFPNSINLLKPDFWYYKGESLGLGRGLLSVLVIVLLAIIGIFSLALSRIIASNVAITQGA